MIISYLFCVLIFTFLLDFISDKLKDNPHMIETPGWNWKTRIVSIIFWPILLVTFIYNFIKTYFKL